MPEELAPKWQAARESALRERRGGERRRAAGAGTDWFDRYAESFEAIWNTAPPGRPTVRSTTRVGRTEYYHDPKAPKANTFIPASNLLVVNDEGSILLQRRRDTGQWALPGGAQDIGESPARCAVRECEEETGIVAEVPGFLGVYSNSARIIEYTDGETRQQYEATYVGRPIGGAPTVNDEADGVRWVHPEELDDLNIHASMREQIGHYLSGNYPYLG